MEILILPGGAGFKTESKVKHDVKNVLRFIIYLPQNMVE